MKVAFFHDAILKKNIKGEYYTSGGLTKEFLSKYLKYFDELVVVTRAEYVTNTEKFSKSSGDKISFNSIEVINPIKILLNKEIKRKIEEEVEKADFIIVRLPSFIGNIAASYAKKIKKNYLVELVACPWDALSNYGNIQGKIMAPIMFQLTKYFVKNAPYVIYVSNNFLQKRYPSKGKTIGCSDVNISEIKEEILNKRLNKIENSSGKNYKLGLIGSLKVNYKGHITAIKAIARLKNPKIELHFLGAGDTTHWKKIAQKYKVEKQVFFDGTLPGGEPVYNWMDEMDIYLIPSLQEGLPRALVEAMSRACPAIGTKTGGIPELLEDEFIINRKDYKKLAEKIKIFLNNSKIMKDSAIKNFKRSTEFEKELLEEKKDIFYKSILNNRNK